MKKANDIYTRAHNNGITLEGTCVDLHTYKIDRYMKNMVRANKQKIHQLLIKYGYMKWANAQLPNPYTFYRTENHLIYVWSGIEHFFRVHN